MAEFERNQRYVLVNGVPGQAGVVVEGLHKEDDEDIVCQLGFMVLGGEVRRKSDSHHRNQCDRSTRNNNVLVLTTFLYPAEVLNLLCGGGFKMVFNSSMPNGGIWTFAKSRNLYYDY